MGTQRRREKILNSFREIKLSRNVDDHSPRISMDRKIRRLLTNPAAHNSFYITASATADNKLDDGSSDEYDTDLECDTSESDQKAKTTPDFVYDSFCRKLKILPNSTLKRQLHLDTCNMSHQKINDRDSIALSLPLQTNDKIQVLDLSDNLINTVGMQYLSYMLTINSTISSLLLEGNQVGQNELALNCLVTGVLANKTVITLDLSNNNLSDKSANLISKLIQNTKVLQNLNLSHNQLSSEAGILIGTSLTINESLHELDLSWNHLRLSGANKIAYSLKDNISLKKLILRMNGFGSIGAASLGLSLKENHSLTELDISENRISMEGAAEFGKSFTGNSALKILRMGRNPIGVQGSLALIKLLEKNDSCSLSLLDLESVMVLDEFMDVAMSIREKLSDFVVKVGTIVSTAKIRLNDGKNEEIINSNPLEVVVHFMESQRMRIVDLFKTWDTDNSQSLSRKEFKEGLKSVNTPLTEAQLDELIEMLDNDGNGEIELSELIHSINVEHKHIRRKVANALKGDGPFPKSSKYLAQRPKSSTIYDQIGELMPDSVNTKPAAQLVVPDTYAPYTNTNKLKQTVLSPREKDEFNFDF